jgi:hypothetical protein
MHDPEKARALLGADVSVLHKGNTVTHVEDFAHNIAYTNITDIGSRGFWRLKGEIKPAS